jgi:hypothetical protein
VGFPLGNYEATDSVGRPRFTIAEGSQIEEVDVAAVLFAKQKNHRLVIVPTIIIIASRSHCFYWGEVGTARIRQTQRSCINHV